MPNPVLFTILSLSVLLGGCSATSSSSVPSASPATGPAPALPSPPGTAGTPGPAVVASAAASQVRPEPPVRVTLPSGRVLPVDPAGTRPDGALAVPDDIRRAGWWTGGSRLGDPFGSIVLASHVDSFTQGVGPAAELLSARPGDEVRLVGAHLVQRYRVASVRLVPRADLTRRSVVFSAGGEGRLVLITCGGEYDASRGGYQDNVVVVARPVGGR
ncbi:class F sortase [Nocardioides sp. MAHUQ-72]|uniref:class F sortase n=1 Tax=unclassified Nocardioides TaxID=2615069 RepID=UPI003615596E